MYFKCVLLLKCYHDVLINIVLYTSFAYTNAMNDEKMILVTEFICNFKNI